MSYCGNIDPTCGGVSYATSLTDCDDLTLATGLADGSYYFTIIDKFGKGHTNQYAVVGGNVTLLMSNYGGSFFNKYSGVYEIFAHTIINIFTRLTLTIDAVEYTSILFTMNSNCCSGVPYVPPTPITDDVTLTINSATFDTIDCSTLYDVVVKNTVGALVGSKIGNEWIVEKAYNNYVEINLNFGIGAEITWELISEIEQAAYYTSIDLTNFDSYTLTVDAVPVSFPFTLEVGETLLFTGVLTDVGSEGLVTLNGVYTNPLVQNDYVIIIAFAPDQISGLQLWLDATDLSTITKDGSNYVSAWLDKSINGYSFTQTIASSQPLYQNSKELYFDGVNDFYDITQVLTPLASTIIGTWACWVKPKVGAGSGQIMAIGDTSANAYINLTQLSGKLRALWIDTSIDWLLITDNVVFVTNTWAHIAIIQDGVSPVLYVNGVAVAQCFTTSVNKTSWINDSLNFDNFRLACFNNNSAGNTSFFNGSIAEPLIFNTNLTPEQIEQIYNYNKNTYI